MVAGFEAFCRRGVRALVRTEAPPPERTQTTVYQSLGKPFTKINLPLDQPPGKESDPQIRGAVTGEESVTPTRWAKPDTLILERFDYYEKLNPSSGKTHIVRSYEITVSFKGDGTANNISGSFATTGKALESAWRYDLA